MNTLRLFAFSVILGAFGLSSMSCKEKGPAEKVGNKIDDALDQRPGEKVRDAVEDVTK